MLKNAHKIGLLFVGLFATLFVGYVLYVNQHGPFKPKALYKIALKTDLDKANHHSCVKLSELDKKSGFIHLSYEHQLDNVLSKFFSKHHKVLVIKLNLKELEKNGSVLKPEANKPGGEIFPHLHGTQTIPCRAIEGMKTYHQNKSGKFFELVGKHTCGCCD